MANPDLRGERDNRMPVNRWSCSGAEATRRGTRVIWRKLDCLKPNLQKTQTDVRRKGTCYRRQLCDGIVQWPLQPSERGALPSEGNQGDEWDAYVALDTYDGDERGINPWGASPGVTECP